MLAKDAALDQVKELLEDERALPEALAPEIIRHLSVLEHEWNPNIDVLEIENEKQQRLAAFLVGGLIFSAYAQQTGAPHVLQPKRSRLFTAVSVRSENASDAFEGQLFGELAKVVRTAGGTFSELPAISFVPLLLKRGRAGETATDVLTRALAFRSLPGVRDYRALMARAFSEWARKVGLHKNRAAA